MSERHLDIDRPAVTVVEISDPAIADQGIELIDRLWVAAHNRSFSPLPRTLITILLLSMSLTRIFASSARRTPVAYSVISITR